MLAFLALFFYHSEKVFQNKLKDSVPCVAEFFLTDPVKSNSLGSLYAYLQA